MGISFPVKREMPQYYLSKCTRMCSLLSFQNAAWLHSGEFSDRTGHVYSAIFSSMCRIGWMIYHNTQKIYLLLCKLCFPLRFKLPWSAGAS
jgi:hypothetical protein